MANKAKEDRKKKLDKKLRTINKRFPQEIRKRRKTSVKLKHKDKEKTIEKNTKGKK